MFSSLIALKLNKSHEIVGYYYHFQKDFSNIYKDISNYFNHSINNIQPLDNFDVLTINKNDSLFISNRYSFNEIAIFLKAKKRTNNLFLYEEGFNMYLPHHFNNPAKSEFNFRNRIKNEIKLHLGMPPNLLALNSFSKVFSTFPIENLKNKKKWNKIEFIQPDIKEKSAINKCLFLSQSLVEDELVDKEKFILFAKNIFIKLSKKYDVIYFKAHPRNSQEIIDSILDGAVNVEFLPKEYNELPAEIFLASEQVDLVGFSSSTLMYASSLFNLKTFQCLGSLVNFSPNKKIEVYYRNVNMLFKTHNIKSLN